MSYNQESAFNYPVHTDYYVDDNDGFIRGDYSDRSDAAFSENHHYQSQMAMHRPINTTSLYTTAQAAIQSQQSLSRNNRYQQHNSSVPYIQHNYQEQHQHQLHSMRPLHSQMQSHDNIHHDYCCPLSTSSQPVTNYQQTSTTYVNNHPQHPLNQTSHRYPSQTRQQLPPVASVDLPCIRQPHRPINVKRHPITVGTPKYYRKPSMSSSLYKRPSALCLPVASQPDPALYRKSRKFPSYDATYHTQQRTPVQITDASHVSMQQPNIPAVMQPHQVHSEGDVNISNLDVMFDKVETGQAHIVTKCNTDITKISKYLKPRLPPSLKAKQERQSIKSIQLGDTASHDSKQRTGTKSVEEKKTTGMDMCDESTDSLEKLLTQLKKCELTSDTSDEMERKEQQRQKLKHKLDIDRNANTDDESKKQSSKPTMKSFNYRDILDSSEIKATTSDSTTSIQDITRKLLLSSSTTNSATGNNHHRRPRTCSLTKPTMLDDNCALELHRSKSYIVDLIDRALSKELGTVPGERSRREFDNMSPKRAIDLVNRHVKPSQDLALEITSTLTDSIISNATAPDTNSINSQRSSNNSSKVCCCAEEPTYIKQLKQLRWGHLKHIQREVKRLEDLERFLDSCSITTIPEDS